MRIESTKSYVLFVALTFLSVSAKAGESLQQRGMSQQVAQVAQVPTKAERQTWRRRMAQTPRPQNGCFVSTYPQTTWRHVQCVAPPERPLLPKKGRGARRQTIGGEGAGDYSGQVTGNALAADGSFDSVSGVTSETGADGANEYTLQLNTNNFTTITCSGRTGCLGWEQYVFWNTRSAIQSVAFIQYWLINYGSTCPNSWTTFQNGDEIDCFRNASAGLNLPVQTIATLGEQTITGVAASGSASDLITVSIGDQLYSITGDSIFPDQGQHWNAAEFNVFGPGDDTEAVFNAGSTIVVRTAMDSATTAPPSCVAESFTGETNNLTLVGTPAAESETQWPSIVFTESNAGSPSTASCSATGVQPVSATATTVSIGLSATLTVTPTGSGPFMYQWYASASTNTGTPIAGATGASLTVSPGATMNYWVEITGPGGLVEYGQTITITVDSSVSGADGPLPLWAVAALGIVLFLFSRRALTRVG